MYRNILLLVSVVLLSFTACSSKKEIVVVNEEGRYGVLDNSGQVVVKAVYDDLSGFDNTEDKNVKTEHPNLINLHWLHNYCGDEYAIAEYKGKYGIVNKNNEMLVKPIYDSISKLFNGFFVIGLDGKYGYMNKEFKVVQKPIFKKVRDFEGNITFVQSTANGKWACLTKDMQLKNRHEYDEAYSLYNGYSRIVKNGKWGFVNDECILVVEPKYDYAYDFTKGLAKVKFNGRIAYVNTKGKEVTKNIFTNGERF